MNNGSQPNVKWIKLIVICWLLVFISGSTVSFGKQQRSTERVDWSVLLPEGEGKTEVSLSCSSCHDLRQTMTQKKSAANWNRTVRKMIFSHHAPVDETDLPVIVSYLSKHFGENNPIEHLPMNINTATAEALARLPSFTVEMANAMVTSRQTQGPFTSMADLSRVKCLTETTLETIKPYITVKE